jgi:hypothetical protein
MRSIATISGFAAVTAAATLAVCWPGRTYAEPPETYFEAGSVRKVTFQGEVARDSAAKSGWAIRVTYNNGGDEDETCTIDTELTKATVNPASRASPPGVAIWRRKDKVTVPAHESIVRTYEVPAWVAAQLTANEKAAQLRQKMEEAEMKKPNPRFALTMRPYTMFSVAFQT